MTASLSEASRRKAAAAVRAADLDWLGGADRRAGGPQAHDLTHELTHELTRARFLALLAGEPDALVRTARPAHLTGSAMVVDPASGAVLVLFHSKLQRWLQPGGHADGDGDLARVAWREATEETGITELEVVGPACHLDIHEVRPPQEAAHLHFDVRFVLVAPPGSTPVGNDESRELRWVAPQELPALGADPGLLALAARAVSVAVPR